MRIYVAAAHICGLDSSEGATASAAIDSNQGQLHTGLMSLQRWLASLFDGLVSTEARVDIDEELLKVVRVRPMMFGAFVSGDAKIRPRTFLIVLGAKPLACMLLTHATMSLYSTLVASIVPRP